MKTIYITSLALSDLKDSGRAYVTALPPGEGVISTAYMRVEDAAQAVRETAGDAVPSAYGHVYEWDCGPGVVHRDFGYCTYNGRYPDRTVTVYATRPATTRESCTPMQPLVIDKHGTIRFKENALVRYLLDNGGIDMNMLSTLEFSDADRDQFAQLIGYSVGGYGELSYVSDESYERAHVIMTGMAP
jgi:hypothetical protein